jgi:uncharacterized protein
LTQIKKIILPVVLLLSVMLQAQVPPRPQPQKLVNDRLDILTPHQEEELESKLVAFDKKTSTQITIYTTDDIDDGDAGDFAVKLGKEWGVGNKNFDNGVVVLVYRNKENTKRKIFIASGNGLEGVLPDYTCSEIVNNEIIPQLKNGNYYAALDNGTNAIIKATEGKYTAPAGYGSGKNISVFKIILIILMIILFLSFMSGKGGGTGGGYMSGRGYKNWNGPVWFPTSGGGGGWSGGGGGGGGFGGFGGGGFGGGGAGGDW